MGIYFPTFFLILLFAVFFCVLFYTLSKKYTKHNQTGFLSSFPFALAAAAIVGRVFSAFTISLQNGESFWTNILYGGNVLYASVIGGIICLLLFAKRRAESALNYLDVYASIVPLGQAIGRIGCFLNGCCYGCEYHGPLSVQYFVNGKEIYVFPTWFIESLFCVLLFVVLQQVIKKNRRGIATSVYCISYSVFRFCIEFFRGDAIRGVWNGISTSQILSIVFLAFGFFVFYKQAKHPSSNIYLASEKLSKGAN